MNYDPVSVWGRDPPNTQYGFEEDVSNLGIPWTVHN